MEDLTTGGSLDLQATYTWVIDVLGLFFDMLSMGVCATRHWQTPSWLVQELNVCTVSVPTWSDWYAFKQSFAILHSTNFHQYLRNYARDFLYSSDHLVTLRTSWLEELFVVFVHFLVSDVTRLPSQGNIYFCKCSADHWRKKTWFSSSSAGASIISHLNGNGTAVYRWTWIWRTTVRQIFAYDGQYAWSQWDAYQVFVICIRRILHMTDQFSWSHWVCHIQVHLYYKRVGSGYSAKV